MASALFNIKRLRMPADARLREAEPLAAKAIEEAAEAAGNRDDDSSATR